METTYAKFVIAREQWLLADDGTQFVRGFDQTTVVGEGRTLRAACRRAGDWATMSGYRVFNGKSGENLGVVWFGEDGTPEVIDLA